MPLPECAGKGTGYRYFGAAKTLPGVKELFEVEPPKQVRKTRYQMHKVRGHRGVAGGGHVPTHVHMFCTMASMLHMRDTKNGCVCMYARTHTASP